MSIIESKSILVVDDDAMVAKALDLLLSMEGHLVETAGDGETALAKYDGVGYDLVIADFLLPGIDGLELARLIRARNPRQRVLLVTAHSETVSGREQGRLKHVDAMLAKPFYVEELHEVLRAMFPPGGSKTVEG